MTDHSDLIAELRTVADQHGNTALRPYALYALAASALSSQSLSLSEAREREAALEKRRDYYRARMEIAERDREDAERWRALMSSQRMHMMGSFGFDYVFDPPDSKKTADLVDVVPRSGDHLHFGIEFWSEHSAFGDPQWPDTFPRKVLTTYVDEMRIRSKALESGPAGLADAHTNTPLSDLSSLRKGAEAPCLHAPTYDAGLCCGHPDDCTFVSPSGLSKGASATEDGIRAKLLRLAKALHAKHYAHVPQWEPFEDAYGLIDQIDNMTAALVSGSREDNP